MEDLLRAAWKVVRVLLGIPGAAIVAAGIVAGGLAGLVLTADWLLNEPNSVKDVELWPDLSSNVGAVGVVAILAFALMLATGLFRAAQIGLAFGSGLLLAVVGVIALLALALVVRGWFGRNEQPQGYLSAMLTILVFAVAAGAIIVLAVMAALKNGGAFDVPHKGWFAIYVGASLGGLALFIPLPEPDQPQPGRGEYDASKYDAPDVSFDVMLVVDPSDPAARRLSALAGERNGLRDTIGWNVAYGLVAVGLPDPPHWKVLRRPTTNVNYLIAPLRRLAAEGRRGPAAYSEALTALAAPRTVPWRGGARRSVVVVADEPPALEAPPGLRVDAVIERGSRRARAALARRIAPGEGVVRRPRIEKRPTLADAEHAAIAPVTPPDHRGLALKHRPLLYFDTDETRAPLDVASVLAERGPNHEPAHELCRPESKLQSSDLTYGDCKGVWEPDDLKPDLDDRDGVLALDVNPAERPDGEFKLRQRIYYHAAESTDKRRLYLDYWIFYRYNDAPRFPRHTCLSGLSVKDATCFDHEGDWEGVTVALERKRPADRYRPESVVYAGHHWRLRFSWESLTHVGATDGKARPKVWVAQGSHASYPAPCGRVDLRPREDRVRQVSCRQPRSDIPDGDRNGEKGWKMNDDDACRAAACAVALPETTKRGPAAWAGFAGHWGLPRCTVGTSLCVRSLGPESPWYQKRYAFPGGPALQDALLRQWYLPRPGELP